MTSDVGGSHLPESLSGPCRWLRYRELKSTKVPKIQSNFVHILVEVPLEKLAVRPPQVRTDAFEIGALHENRMNNEICCFDNNQTERDEWIATFQRMGVAIFD